MSKLSNRTTMVMSHVTVNLNERICTCPRWHYYGAECCHNLKIWDAYHVQQNEIPVSEYGWRMQEWVGGQLEAVVNQNTILSPFGSTGAIKKMNFPISLCTFYCTRPASSVSSFSHCFFLSSMSSKLTKMCKKRSKRTIRQSEFSFKKIERAQTSLLSMISSINVLFNVVTFYRCNSYLVAKSEVYQFLSERRFSPINVQHLTSPKTKDPLVARILKITCQLHPLPVFYALRKVTGAIKR